MLRRGYCIVSYLDDFILFPNTQSRCLQALSELIALPIFLGFVLNYAKVTKPNTRVVSGLLLDSVLQHIEVPLEELHRFFGLAA